jgi:predicted ATP-dependent endonuclease of OLD family
MLLKKVIVNYFKSTREQCELVIDPRVSILLGANDHGKSNLLQAISHLNPDNPFTIDDINWDTPDSEIKRSPSIMAEFALTILERQKLTDIVEKTLNKIVPEPPSSENIENKTELGSKLKKQISEDKQINPLYASLMESSLRITRVGIPGSLYLNDHLISDYPDKIQEWIKDNQPRFELLSTFGGEIQDQADAMSIANDSSEFIQGIFFKAGLEQKDWKDIFPQNDLTMKRLDKASEVLNRNLSGMWGQGKDLQFKLRHQANTIQLMVSDPAIDIRYVRLSKKSTGVTHFFRLSMTLHARKKKNPANSYIYLFDEPGVYLHPLGQRDLLQVFELLADTSQIILATHSLFLLNANFPERHRLVIMDEHGTKVDHKPYRASWRFATDALGVRLGSMALFTDRTLLVEGESDPMYLYELIRILNLLGATDVDANQLGIMSYTNVPTLKYLIQILTSDPHRSQLAILLDGDKGGVQVGDNIKTLCQTKNIPIISLPSGFSIENLCLFQNEFEKSIVDTIQAACEAEGKAIPTDLIQKVNSELLEYRQSNIPKADGSKELVSLGYWFKKFSEEIVGSEASKTALARRYAEYCRENITYPLSDDNNKVVDATIKGHATKLVEQIVKELKLPSLKASETVLKESSKLSE